MPCLPNLLRTACMLLQTISYTNSPQVRTRRELPWKLASAKLTSLLLKNTAIMELESQKHLPKGVQQLRMSEHNFSEEGLIMYELPADLARRLALCRLHLTVNNWGFRSLPTRWVVSHVAHTTWAVPACQLAWTWPHLLNTGAVHS